MLADAVRPHDTHLVERRFVVVRAEIGPFEVSNNGTDLASQFIVPRDSETIEGGTEALFSAEGSALPPRIRTPSFKPSKRVFAPYRFFELIQQRPLVFGDRVHGEPIARHGLDGTGRDRFVVLRRVQKGGQDRVGLRCLLKLGHRVHKEIMQLGERC
jgi:hypothetical protein